MDHIHVRSCERRHTNTYAPASAHSIPAQLPCVCDICPDSPLVVHCKYTHNCDSLFATENMDHSIQEIVNNATHTHTHTGTSISTPAQLPIASSPVDVLSLLGFASHQPKRPKGRLVHVVFIPLDLKQWLSTQSSSAPSTTWGSLLQEPSCLGIK